MYFDGEGPDGIDCSALAVDKGKVYQVAIDDNKMHKFEIDMSKCFAIGSGRDHAYTAMDLGCSAVDAVKMAIKRDMCTGGKVRSFKVK